MTIAQKKVRVGWWIEIFEKFDGDDSKDVYKIVPGNESWLGTYEPEK